MLTSDAAAAVPEAKPPLRRILAICEDVEAALRVASYLAEIPAAPERIDLGALEAVELLQDSLAAPIDLVLFAPSGESVGLRPGAQTLVDLAAHKAGSMVLLLAPGLAHGLSLPPSVEVVITDAEAEPPEAAPPKGLRGLFARWRGGRQGAAPPVQPTAAPAQFAGRRRLVSFQSLAGGAGSSTLASLFAAEVAATHPGLRVLLIDLDLQFGQIGANFDMKEDPRITDFYSSFGKLDLEAFGACLHPLGNNFLLLQAPPEILPLDALDPRKMPKFLRLARETADIVVIDLPHIVADWMDPIWREVDLAVAVAERGMRSSYAFRRLKVLTEGRAFDPRRSEIWLNRAPLRPRREEAEELDSLKRAFSGLGLRLLPEGGDAIRTAQVQGLCPRRVAPGSALVAGVAAEVRRLSPALKAQPLAPSNPGT